MNWEDLRFLLALAQTKSLKGAAEKLQVNSTTVSRRLKAMEEQAGVRLYDNLKDGVVLTDAGQLAVHTAQQMEDLTHNLNAKIEGMDTILEGKIRVTSTEGLLQTWLSDFAHFHKQYPKIELNLQSTYDVLSLAQREADVAIRLGRNAPENLIGRRMAQIRLALYGSRKLFSKRNNINNVPWIGWNQPLPPNIQKQTRKLVGDKKPMFCVDSPQIMIKCLIEGIGIAFLACFEGDRNPELIRLTEPIELDAYLWLLVHPDLISSARIKVFKDFMAGVIKRDRDLLEGRRPIL